mmetsp:Transcript_1169/g.2339  ORF Transcript_1169/g.2339 Transcript_1169/m.2339 type:complete len:338 (+) Transcript_1169:622-1635(+)
MGPRDPGRGYQTRGRLLPEGERARDIGGRGGRAGRGHGAPSSRRGGVPAREEETDSLPRDGQAAFLGRNHLLARTAGEDKGWPDDRKDRTSPQMGQRVGPYDHRPKRHRRKLHVRQQRCLPPGSRARNRAGAQEPSLWHGRPGGPRRRRRIRGSIRRTAGGSAGVRPRTRADGANIGASCICAEDLAAAPSLGGSGEALRPPAHSSRGGVPVLCITRARGRKVHTGAPRGGVDSLHPSGRAGGGAFTGVRAGGSRHGAGGGAGGDGDRPRAMSPCTPESVGEKGGFFTSRERGGGEGKGEGEGGGEKKKRRRRKSPPPGDVPALREKTSVENLSDPS